MSYAGSGSPGPFISLAAFLEPAFHFRFAALVVTLLVFWGLELVLARRARPAGRWAERARHLALLVINVVVLAFAAPLALGVIEPLLDKLVAPSPAPFAEMPAFPRIVLSFVTLDLALWLFHRASHAIPTLWRLHRVHHSDEALDVTTSLRFHPADLLGGLLVVSIVSSCSGIDPETLLLFQLFSAVVSQAAHASLRLPRSLERALALLFVTPGSHAVHHSAGSESRSNYGASLSLWDHLFRTDREFEPVKFGSAAIDGDRPGLLGLLFLPLDELPEGRVRLGLREEEA
ncbi:MAG: sterol desaturase family protein [Thermoanaerobaculia bacterium]